MRLNGQTKSLNLCLDIKTLEPRQEKKVNLYDMVYLDKNTYHFAQGKSDMCEFSLSVIKREFPPNNVTATTRDHKRNTCPTHANSRRVVKAIYEGHSCRELGSQVMWDSPDISVSEPVTLLLNCV